MHLEIQTLLRNNGLQDTKEFLKLIVKEQGNLVLFKYNQIERDWTQPALWDCRGLILDSADNWNVVAYPYRKFFNLGEGYGQEIDMTSAKIYTKSDGSLITLYWYKDKWNVATTGTIDASSDANAGQYTFADLFWKAAEVVYGSVEEFISRIDTNFNYMFELMTPYNLVVTLHSDFKLELHGARDMRTWKEVDIESITNLVKVKTCDDIKSIEDIYASFEGMTWQEEGYIICDKNFNRVKIKNPAYVAAHHIATGQSPYFIMSIVKANELDEFLVYFPTRKDEFYDLQNKYNSFINYIQDIFDGELKHYLNLSDKDYAHHVFDITAKYNIKKFSGLFFSIKKGKEITVRDFINDFRDNDLFNMLTEWNAN